MKDFFDKPTLDAELNKSAQRAKLFSYLTIISVALGFIQLVVGIMNNTGNLLSLFPFIIQTVISLVLAYNLFKYASFISKYEQSKDSSFFSVSLGHLKNYFIVFGVLFIILFSLILFGILISILAMIIS
ncbi:MAG: hypothetical protein IT215_03945 [Chitinophagaceae bacterium]|nr:hypothetical protein [Chitinophagaceae bacterium]HMN31740.1 hypothetical protein [Chitinophagaceae bacterium]